MFEKMDTPKKEIAETYQETYKRDIPSHERDKYETVLSEEKCIPTWGEDKDEKIRYEGRDELTAKKDKELAEIGKLDEYLESGKVYIQRDKYETVLSEKCMPTWGEDKDEKIRFEGRDEKTPFDDKDIDILLDELTAKIDEYLVYIQDNDTDKNEVSKIEKITIKIDMENENDKKQLDNVEPNTIYELSNGNKIETDEKGRVILYEFTPVLTEKERTSQDSAKTKEVGNQGIDGDEGGHIQAHSLGGDSSYSNLFPQNQNFNRGEYKKLENTLREAVKEGKDVTVTVKLIYDDPQQPEKRPSKLEVTYVIDGKPTIVTFKNQPGGV
ncbi:DNA/RNA non-specific endonuclease [Gallibacterium melopsittaci]|uniref:DNA/RNA non-specific endonuclease n=1 Tax=Gallibacterium melopsittaci TaxID=516063 RepID=A0ABV6HYJ1_9PAST